MTQNDINDIYVYFKILKNINIYYRKLTKYNLQKDEREDYFYSISEHILRLLPIKSQYNSKGEILLICEFTNDGIMKLENNFFEIRKNLSNVLKKHYVQLVQMKTIRNKYEHEPHNLKCVCFMNDGKNTSIIFKYKENTFALHTLNIYNLIFDINNEFKKIKNQVYNEAKSNNLENKLKYFKFNFIGEKNDKFTKSM